VLIGLMCLISISRSEAGYLDVALILALLSFTGTIAAVRYHEDGHL
jgi:multisubunit Na+/H+ antiporter MnhF subunit